MDNEAEEKNGIKEDTKPQESIQEVKQNESNESCNAKVCICNQQKLAQNIRKHCIHYGIK